MTKGQKHNTKINKNLKNKLSFSEIFVILSSIFLLLLLLKNPALTQESVFISLKKCAVFLIPSLFPMMVVSEITMESGAIERLTRPLNKIVSRILGIEKEAAPPFFLGLVGGYTTSSGGALSLYKSGRISKRDCERVIALSSLPSLSFLTGFVGTGIFQSARIGWILWGISVASALILGLLTQSKKALSNEKRAFKKDYPNNICTSIANTPSFSKIIVGAISHSATSMLIICACVIFFSALIDALHYPLSSLKLSKNAELMILGSLELTNGISSCTELTFLTPQICSAAFFIGWSGLCVHFQIMSICENAELSFKKYFIFKALQGIVCALLAFVIFSNPTFKF